jgi:hypothetical protein
MHHSRLCAVLIDCKTSSVEAAAEFWGEALGRHAGAHRSTLCVVRVQRPGFPKNANRWD